MILLFFIPTAYSQTTKLVILSSEDSSVDQDSPDTPKLPTTNPKYEDTTFGDWIFLSSGTVNPKDWYSNNTVTNNAYIKFDISNVPQTDAFNIVNIGAELQLLVQEIDADSDRTLITIHSCQNNSWREDNIIWDNRPCQKPGELVAEDTILIKESELPNTFSWDVSRSVSDARSENHNYVTLVVSTVPLKHVENLPYNLEFTSALGTSLAWI